MDSIWISYPRGRIPVAVTKVQTRRSQSELKGEEIGVSVNDLSGRFLLVNRAYCRMTGYSERELESRTFQSITHPDDLDGNRRLARRMLAGEISSILYEKRYIRKESEIIWVRNSVSMMVDAYGNPVRSVAIAEPITAPDELVGSLACKTRGFRLISKTLRRPEEQERRRIGRELHDSTGQLLTGLVMTLTRLQSPRSQPPDRDRLLAQALALARQCSREVRTLSYLLHPPLLEECGLAAALHTYAEGFRLRTGIELKLSVPRDFGRLNYDLEIAILRIVQEALANIHRHSGSPAAVIDLERLPSQVVLMVQDWGCGLRSPSVGVGLAGMRERAKLLGGRFNICSTREGTRITVILPCSGTHEKDTHPHR